jgi:hypothetical protein
LKILQISPDKCKEKKRKEKKRKEKKRKGHLKTFTTGSIPYLKRFTFTSGSKHFANQNLALYRISKG